MCYRLPRVFFRMTFLNPLLSTQKRIRCADEYAKSTRPSKVSGALLPLEYYLERLVAKVENPLPSWNLSNPACEWNGVRCKNKEIQGLTWHKLNIGGELNFATLSSFLYFEEIVIKSTSLSGNIPLENFPESMELIALAMNLFSGPIDLTRLPSHLKKCHLYQNKLSEEIDLTQLPLTLEVLSLHENAFSGTVELTKLPPKLRHLVLSDNIFEGSIDLGSLPDALEHFWIENNRFSGIVDLRLVSPTLVYFDLTGNFFEEFIGTGPSCAKLRPQISERE